MKLTAEDYKRHYRDLSDEEFLAIGRDDLVELARQCYDAEMTRRRLAPEPLPEAAPELEYRAGAAEPGPAEDLVQVGVLDRYESATYAQRLLQDADIPASLGTRAGGPFGAGAFRLMVPPSCADAARDLLAGPLTEANKALVRNWFEKEWTPEGLDLNEFSVTLDDLFGEEDKVAVRITVEGVNPRDGKDVKFGGIAIVRVADGNIAETWIKLDS